jgi:hypothetical protein
MKQNEQPEFWSGLGDRLRPRLSEAQWAAQRARILARLTPAASGRLTRWAAATALACLAGVCFCLPGLLTRTQLRAPAQPAPWNARVTMVQGQVAVFARGSEDGVPAQVGMPLDEGDEVRTGSDGHAELALSADSVIGLNSDSILALSNLEQKQTLLGLDVGTLVVKLHWEGPRWRRLEVETPTAVAAVRGTEFGVTVQEGGDTSVGVFDEGKVAVRTKEPSSIAETMITPHQEVTVPKGQPAETEMKEGRSCLRVNGLSRLKPYQEQIERLRQRPEALNRTWREMASSEREEIRTRLAEEHQNRMLALSPEERQSLRQRLRGHQDAPSGGAAADRQVKPEEAVPARPAHLGGPGAGKSQQDIRREGRENREIRQSRQSYEGRPSPSNVIRGRQPAQSPVRGPAAARPQRAQNRIPAGRNRPLGRKNAPPGR